MTPKDCRAKADQYFQWVQDAQTSYERRVYEVSPRLAGGGVIQ